MSVFQVFGSLAVQARKNEPEQVHQCEARGQFFHAPPWGPDGKQNAETFVELFLGPGIQGLCPIGQEPASMVAIEDNDGFGIMFVNVSFPVSGVVIKTCPELRQSPSTRF